MEILSHGGGGVAPTMMTAPYQSGRYYWTPPSLSASTVVLTKEVERATPFYVPTAVTLIRVGGQVTSAGDVGSKVRFGFRGDDGTGRPGTLLLDAGTIAGDSAAVQEITISLALNANTVYWVTTTTQVVTVTAPTVACINGSGYVLDVGTSAPTATSNNYGHSQTGVTGALPSTWTDAGATQNVMRVFSKVQ